MFGRIGVGRNVFGAGHQLTGKGRGRESCQGRWEGERRGGQEEGAGGPLSPRETEKMGGGTLSWGQVTKAHCATRSWGASGRWLHLGEELMDWGAMGRAGTGRSPSPRGTKGLGVARASAEAATVGPQPRAPGGPRGRGHARSRTQQGVWEPRSGPRGLGAHPSVLASFTGAGSEGSRAGNWGAEWRGRGLTSPDRPSPAFRSTCLACSLVSRRRSDQKRPADAGCPASVLSTPSPAPAAASVPRGRGHEQTPWGVE